MAKLTERGKDKPDIITIAWLKQQFDQIDGANVLTLNKVEEVNNKCTLILAEIKKIGDLASASVIPELETAVKTSLALATSIDRKVPDSDGCTPQTTKQTKQTKERKL